MPKPIKLLLFALLFLIVSTVVAIAGYAVGFSHHASLPVPLPTPEPYRSEPLGIVYQLNDTYDSSGCFGKITVLRPLPLSKESFKGKFEYIFIDSGFMGDGYRYIVAANPLWGCEAMKKVIEEAQR